MKSKTKQVPAIHLFLVFAAWPGFNEVAAFFLNRISFTTHPMTF